MESSSRKFSSTGAHESSRQVVEFYNTRDLEPERWGPPEVPATMNTEELGNLGLSDQEVDDIVAFLKTLTDGYVPAEGTTR